MYLQGDLQTVFDALYNMGLIDPVLEMDWAVALEEMHHHYDEFSRVVNVANIYQTDMQSLICELGKFNETTLGYLAIEVARELADFHARGELH